MVSRSFHQRILLAVKTWGKGLALRLVARRPLVDPTRGLVIIASLRGGSTWLEELVRTIPRTATIYEPLDIDQNPAFRRIGFWWRQHIPDDARWPEAEEAFADLLAGRHLTPYLTMTTRMGELLRADRLVFKICRGHLLLPWLIGRFQLPKPVFLIRHPCAVVRSQMDWERFQGLKPVNIPPSHRYDHLYRSQLPLLESCRTLEERLALAWAIDHKYLLDHPLNDVGWTTITYEELMTRPHDTLRKVFTAWGMSVPQAALDNIDRASRTSRATGRLDPTEQLAKWRKQLTTDQQDRILDTVHRAGVDLYGRDVMPTRTFTPA